MTGSQINVIAIRTQCVLEAIYFCFSILPGIDINALRKYSTETFKNDSRGVGGIQSFQWRENIFSEFISSRVIFASFHHGKEGKKPGRTSVLARPIFKTISGIARPCAYKLNVFPGTVNELF